MQYFHSHSLFISLFSKNNITKTRANSVKSNNIFDFSFSTVLKIVEISSIIKNALLLDCDPLSFELILLIEKFGRPNPNIEISQHQNSQLDCNKNVFNKQVDVCTCRVINKVFCLLNI